MTSSDGSRWCVQRLPGGQGLGTESPPSVCCAWRSRRDSAISVPDPGIGTIVSHRSQILGHEELQALIERWPAVLNVVRESERVPWRELFELVRTWLVPQASFFPPVRFGAATDKILRNFAGTMLHGMASVSRQHPGIQHRIGELAQRIGEAPELSLHPEFEVLYPSKPLGVEDREHRYRSWSDALARLADNWRDRSLDEVASFLKWCEYEADLAGIDRPRFSPEFCVHLAERVSDPVAAAEALVGHALPSVLVAPFLRKAAADGHPGWTGFARRCLEEGEYRLERGGDGVGATYRAIRAVRRGALPRSRHAPPGGLRGALVFGHAGGCGRGDAAIERPADCSGRRGRLLAGSTRRGSGVATCSVATRGCPLGAGGSRRAARRLLARGDIVQRRRPRRRLAGVLADIELGRPRLYGALDDERRSQDGGQVVAT